MLRIPIGRSYSCHVIRTMISSHHRASQFNRAVCRRLLSSSSSPPPPPSSSYQKFWEWTLQHRPSYRENFKEAAVICTVFAITGSSTLVFVRPVLKQIGVEGSMMEGPWSYRISSIVLISPIYSMLLITLGTLAGRHRFFATMGVKIMGRMLPSSLKKRLLCEPAKASVTK